MTKKAKAE
jgi:hypothetical protein